VYEHSLLVYIRIKRWRHTSTIGLKMLLGGWKNLGFEVFVSLIVFSILESCLFSFVLVKTLLCLNKGHACPDSLQSTLDDVLVLILFEEDTVVVVIDDDVNNDNGEFDTSSAPVKDVDDDDDDDIPSTLADFVNDDSGDAVVVGAAADTSAAADDDKIFAIEFEC